MQIKKVQKKFDGIKVCASAESIFALGGSALVLLVWGCFPPQLWTGGRAWAGTDASGGKRTHRFFISA